MGQKKEDQPWTLANLSGASQGGEEESLEGLMEASLSCSLPPAPHGAINCEDRLAPKPLTPISNLLPSPLRRCTFSGSPPAAF